MEIIRRIFAALAVPLALIMLVTGLSFVPKSKQEKLEAAVEAELQEDFQPVFRFAVASDVHIMENDPTNTERLRQMLDTAYRYAESQDYASLDAVVLCGDNCNTGSDGEYDILNSVFEEKLREGTELFTVMGNHEFARTGHEGYVRHMGQPLDRHAVIKGFHFIGLSPDPDDTKHTLKQADWMARELNKAADDDPKKPIFTLQHGHIWNTVYVSRSWHTQAFIQLHGAYSVYPQVINFSGHSHGPLNNPINIWQNNYTTLGAGTLNYFEMERDIGDNTVPAGARNAAQFLFVEVDEANRVLIRPFNLLTDAFMKTPSTTDDPEKELKWLISDPTDPLSFAYTSARKKTASTPYFEDGDTASAEDAGEGKVTVSFPQAEDDVCVYGYRITLTDTAHPRDKGKKIVKEIYSEYYFEPRPETLSCTVEGLVPGTEYKVTVAPLNVWLKEGAPLTLTYTAPQN